MPIQSSECQGDVRLHSFSLRAFPQICHGDVGIVTTFRKSFDRGSFEFCFTEDTIRNCKDFDFPGATLRLSSKSNEETANHGLMKKNASVVFDFGSMSIHEASVEVEKSLGGEEESSVLQVQARWCPTSNALTLHEELKIDQKNEISGSYNFSTDEAFFGYRRTFSGSWRASARYDVQSSCGEYTLDRIFKADGYGQEGILSMVHCPKKDIAKVLYDQGQWNMSIEKMEYISVTSHKANRRVYHALTIMIVMATNTAPAYEAMIPDDEVVLDIDNDSKSHGILQKL